MDYKEKLKSIVNSDNTPIVDIDTFLKYFPELKESKDEKIRRALIDMMLDTPSVECEKNYKIRKDDVLDWLEKLGEQQNTYKNGVYQEANGVRIWHNGHTFLVPKDWNKGEWPLLNGKGKKNSKQKNKRIMSEVDALLDWDFIAATKHVQNLGTDIPLKNGEYLITAPVWLAIYENRIELNKALNNIGAVEIDFNKSFWLAQQSSTKRAWHFIIGHIGSLANSYTTFAYQVVAIML